MQFWVRKARPTFDVAIMGRLNFSITSILLWCSSKKKLSRAGPAQLFVAGTGLHGLYYLGGVSLAEASFA